MRVYALARLSQTDLLGRASLSSLLTCVCEHACVCVCVCTTATMFKLLLAHRLPSLASTRTSDEGLLPRTLAALPASIPPTERGQKSRLSGSGLQLLSSPWKPRAKIAGAADILGVYVIYQTLGCSALSPRSRKELAVLPAAPKPQEGRVLLGSGTAGPLARGVKRQRSGTCWPQKARGRWKGPT